MMNTDKTYVITGGSQGIGLATALRLAEENCHIIILAKPSDGITSVCDKIESLGSKATFINTDIRSEESITAAVRVISHSSTTVDGFIHCATVVKLSNVFDTTPAQIDLMHQINARAPMLISKALVQLMQGSENPHIVFIAPPINLDPRWLGAHLPYTASRYLCAMTAVGLSQELRGDRIKVNTMWPMTSIAAIDICNVISGTYGDMMSKKRKPQIIADAICVLLDKSDINGQCLIDEQVLIDAGIDDFEHYSIEKDGYLQPEQFNYDLAED